MKPKVKHLFFLAVMAVFLTVAAGPAPVQPDVQIKVVTDLPATMNVGESYTMEVLVTSNITFINAIAMPSAFFPGRYVVSQGGGDLAHAGTSAPLYITFTAKDSTAELPDGVAPVAVSVGVRYPGGIVVSERFDRYIAVP